MNQETSQHHSPASAFSQEPVVVELSLEEIAAVAGGPQILNDSVLPP